HLQSGADVQNGGTQGLRTLVVALDGGDGPVQLHDVHGQGVQLGEGVEPGAEVVERQAYAPLAQAPAGRGGTGQVTDPARLGDLQNQPARPRPVLVEHATDRDLQLGLTEAAGRDVDVHVDVRTVPVGQRGGVRAGPGQDEGV